MPVYDESCGVLARPPTVRPTTATTAPATTGRTSLARAPCCAANQTRPVKLFPPRALGSSPLQPPRTQSCCSKLGTYKMIPGKYNVRARAAVFTLVVWRTCGDGGAIPPMFDTVYL